MAPDAKPKVLLLDDEKFLLNLYTMSLEQKGFEVVAYHDVDEALAKLRSGYDPQVVLFDITMPDSRSGYEFIEALHREHLAKHAIKYALTNEGQDGPITRLKELGADGHLLKADFIPAELAEKVAQLAKANSRWTFF